MWAWSKIHRGWGWWKETQSKLFTLTLLKLKPPPCLTFPWPLLSLSTSLLLCSKLMLYSSWSYRPPKPSWVQTQTISLPWEPHSYDSMHIPPSNLFWASHPRTCFHPPPSTISSRLSLPISRAPFKPSPQQSKTPSRNLSSKHLLLPRAKGKQTNNFKHMLLRLWSLLDPV